MLVLRELGATVEWHLPSRFEEGYGLARETLDALAADGSASSLTVDCGITAVEEVARRAGARARRSRHGPPPARRDAARLPDRRDPAVRYPFPELCGTGVVYKLGQALLGADAGARRHLDLVALATIADVVPLVDENRALAVAGLRALARRSARASRR